MIPWLQALAAGFMAIAGALFAARMARAPTAQDRILALDGAALTLVGYLLFQGDRVGGHYYLDGALALALLSFVATVALAKASEDRDDG